MGVIEVESLDGRKLPRSPLVKKLGEEAVGRLSRAPLTGPGGGVPSRGEVWLVQE
jgi:hypothetical protein